MNPDGELIVVETDWATDGERMTAIRFTVFVDEQQVDKELELDGADPELAHFLVTSAGEPVGTGRFQPDGRIQRMAVLKEFRGHGVGRLLIEAMIEKARASGLNSVYLHSQDHAVGFYEKMDFVVDGEMFIEADIPHYPMSRAI